MAVFQIGPQAIKPTVMGEITSGLQAFRSGQQQQQQQNMNRQLNQLRLQQLRAQIEQERQPLPPGFVPSSITDSPSGRTVTSRKPEAATPTASDAKFYIDRGYSPVEAKSILDKKFGLEGPQGKGRVPKEIATELSKWQTIYNKTREVGVLGQFGDIHDPETAELATETIAGLRDELIGSLAKQEPPDVQTVPPSMPSPSTQPSLGDVDAVTGADKKAPAQQGQPQARKKWKLRNAKGAIFQVPVNEIGKWIEKGFKIDDPNIVTDERGWIQYTSPDGVPVWVDPKDIQTARSRGYTLSK